MRHLLSFVALLMVTSSAGAERLPIRFDVPVELNAYTGLQPVTFGVPFEQGTLAVADPVAVVDDKGNVMPAQFEVTSTWTSEGEHVRWLLIDTFADIRNGKASPRLLTWGEGVHGSLAEGPVVDHVGSRAAVGDITINPDGGNVGQFTLVTGDGTVYQPRGNYQLELERGGPVRTVLKASADYVDADGNTIGEAVTRYRIYSGQPFMRVYHTLIWQTTDDVTIAALRYDTPAQGAASIGLDGRAIEGPNPILVQTAHDTVIGSAEGNRLDGWVQCGNTFAAVRWPWQQFPMRFAVEAGHIGINLIGSTEPMSLKPAAVAVDNVQPPREYNEWDIQDIIVGAKKVDQISPRGIAKTWELLLWTGDADMSPQLKNAALQTPVLAYADPAFAVRANLPSPMSACDPQRFPIIEPALSRAFDWFTIPQAREGDLGVWNFGDVQWAWTLNGWPIYRYWMNQGKGWSVVPWLLYLRSGERKYLDFAEASARHVMDVDTCHVPEWTYQPDGKRRGAPYSYSSMHWCAGPFLAEFQAESEYLPNAYYISGYERAHDVMLEVAEALATFEYDERWLKDFRESRDKAHRHLYAMIKELGVLYEATWDPRLKVRLDEYFELTAKAQGEDGDFPNVKTNHYLSQPLNLAVRFFGVDRALPLLRKWQAFRGDVFRIGETGSIAGPMSLWTLVTLDEFAGDDAHYLDVAARTARTQALSIIESDNEWHGMHPVWGPETGPHLRDWVTTMAGLARRDAPPSSDLLPMPSLHGRLQPSEADAIAGYTWRHVMLVPADEAGKLTLHVYGIEAGVCELRVTDPQGNRVATESFTFENTRHATAGIAWVADGAGKVFAVELLTQGRFPDVIRARSSNGKLLHLVSPKEASFVSEAHVGTLWAKPRSGADVVIGLVQNVWVSGRAVILDEQGSILATTQVTGTREQKQAVSSRLACRWVPQGAPCTLPAPESGKLLQLLIPVQGVAHLWWSITGIEPYVSTTREQWFDPTTQAHPDIAQLMAIDAR